MQPGFTIHVESVLTPFSRSDKRSPLRVYSVNSFTSTDKVLPKQIIPSSKTPWQVNNSWTGQDIPDTFYRNRGLITALKTPANSPHSDVEIRRKFKPHLLRTQASRLTGLHSEGTAQGPVAPSCWNDNSPLGSIKKHGEFRHQLSNHKSPIKKESAPVS